MTNLEKHFPISDTKSLYSDQTTLINHHITDSPHNTQTHTPLHIPRVFHLNNIVSILNKPYRDSRRCHPTLYHSTNLSNTYDDNNNIYESYTQYQDDIQHRNKKNIQSPHYKYLKHTTSQEQLLLNEKMIDEFWLNDNLPNDTDFDLSSDEEKED